MREDVECANGGHDEAAGLHGAEHGVGVLPEGPLINEEAPKAGELDFVMGAELVADRMLHPGIGGDDEIAAQPGADKYKKGGPPVPDAA